MLFPDLPIQNQNLISPGRKRQPQHLKSVQSKTVKIKAIQDRRKKKHLGPKCMIKINSGVLVPISIMDLIKMVNRPLHSLQVQKPAEVWTAAGFLVDDFENPYSLLDCPFLELRM